VPQKPLKSKILIVITVCCFVGGCGGGRSQFRYAELPISYSAVTHVADSLGYAKAQGLNYFVISVPAGPDVVASLRNAGPSGAYAGGIAVTPVITMIAADAHPVILGTTLDSDQQVQVVTFSRTGITKDAASLRGKRVGVVRNTVGDIYLSRWLAQAGAHESDLVVVDGRPGDLRSLLVDGALDAAILWDPFVAQSVQRYKERVAKDPSRNRGDPVVLVDPTMYHLAFNIVTTRDYLQSKRSEMMALLRASISAADYVNSDPHRSQIPLEKWLTLDGGDLDHFMKTTQFKVHLDVPRMKDWMRTELEWLRSKQPDTKIPADFSQFIDTSLLKSINPALVTE